MNDAQQHVIRHQANPPESGDLIAEFSGLRVSSILLDAGESFAEETDTETAWLLMDGKIRGQAGDTNFELERHSLFDESASCLHASAETAVTLEAITACELTVYQCPNRKPFPARVYTP